MEVSTEAVRQNFQLKTDGELLQVAAHSEELTSEARLFLVLDVSSLRFASPERRRFHRFWWRTTSVASAVPHCSDCATELKRSRAIWSWVGGTLAVLWLATVIWFQLPRFVSYIGFFMIALPVRYFYDRTSAVKLGDHDDGVVEYRFRSHDYAKTFAALNEVQAQNAETIQLELEDAISHLQ